MDVGLPQLLTESWRMFHRMETMAMWCYLSVFFPSYITKWLQYTDSRWFFGGGKKQRHEFKAGLKSLFKLRDWEHEWDENKTMRKWMSLSKTLIKSACADVCLHLALEWVNMKQHKKSFSRRNSAQEMLGNLIEGFFLVDRIHRITKCKESICLFFSVFHLTAPKKRMFAWLFAFAEKYEVKRMYYWNASSATVTDFNGNEKRKVWKSDRERVNMNLMADGRKAINTLFIHFSIYRTQMCAAHD